MSKAGIAFAGLDAAAANINVIADPVTRGIAVTNSDPKPQSGIGSSVGIGRFANRPMPVLYPDEVGRSVTCVELRRRSKLRIVSGKDLRPSETYISSEQNRFRSPSNLGKGASSRVPSRLFSR